MVNRERGTLNSTAVVIGTLLFLASGLVLAQGWGSLPSGPPPGGDRDPAVANTTVSDPVGDTFGSGPIQHDIIEFTASYTGDDVFLELVFNDPISPPDGDGPPDALVGGIDMDVDQNPNTGSGSLGDEFCPDPIGIGAEYQLSLFDYDPQTGQTVLYDLATGPVGNVDLTFTSNSVSAFVPLDLLGDDGILDTATVIGTIMEPTDCAPNGGFITTSAGGVPTAGPWALALIAAVLTLGGLGFARRLQRR